MASIVLRFKLNVTFVESWETQVLDLPSNSDIFQLLPDMDIIYIVDAYGNAEAAVAFITVVNRDGNELV